MFVSIHKLWHAGDLVSIPGPGAKTIKKNTNSTQNKSQTHRAKEYEVTSFLSTDCELSTETCSKNVYSLGPRQCYISGVKTWLSTLHNFFYCVSVSFGGDTKSRRSLLSGVYATGSKISHTGGDCVTCRGRHILWAVLLLVFLNTCSVTSTGCTDATYKMVPLPMVR